MDIGKLENITMFFFQYNHQDIFKYSKIQWNNFCIDTTKLKHPSIVLDNKYSL